MMLLFHSPSTASTEVWQLLVNCCKAVIGNEKIESPSLNADQWSELYDLSIRHNISALVHQALKNYDQIPPNILYKLKSSRLLNVAKHLNDAQELRALVQLFAKEEVQIIPYKGLLLTQSIFEDLSLRYYSDIDFLYKEGDFSSIQNILTKRGYQLDLIIPKYLEKPYKFFNCERNFRYPDDHQKKHFVEPHWSLGVPMNQIDVTYVDLLPFTSMNKVLGVDMLVLSPEGHIISICCHHGGNHKYDSLKQLCDLYALINLYSDKIDWKLLLTTASKLKIGNLLLIGLAIVDYIFDVNFPKEVSDKIRNGKFDKQISGMYSLLQEYPDLHLVRRPIKRVWFHLEIRKNISTKSRIIFYFICNYFFFKIFLRTREYLFT